MPNWASITISVTAGLVAACALKQEARLYSMTDGRVSSLMLRNVQATHGAVTGTLPTGESCEGTFEILGEEARALPTAGRLPIGKHAEAGFASIGCASGIHLNCELARSQQGFSYGACKDQRGVEYALLFEEASP